MPSATFLRSKSLAGVGQPSEDGRRRAPRRVTPTVGRSRPRQARRSSIAPGPGDEWVETVRRRRGELRSGIDSASYDGGESGLRDGRGTSPDTCCPSESEADESRSRFVFSTEYLIPGRCLLDNHSLHRGASRFTLIPARRATKPMRSGKRSFLGCLISNPNINNYCHRSPRPAGVRAAQRGRARPEAIARWRC